MIDKDELGKKKKNNKKLTCFVDENNELTCFVSKFNKQDNIVIWKCSICNFEWKDILENGSKPLGYRKCKKCSREKIKSLKKL
ncbi:MAG: hypothetical protein ACFFAS_06880 [Promethearchaeota archaeon]